MAVEALRTQLDSLQWEVNRLDAENRKLRSGNDAVSRVVDLEAELNQAKQDSAELATELEACRAEVAQALQRTTDAAEKIAQVEALESTLSEAQEETTQARAETAQVKEAKRLLVGAVFRAEEDAQGARDRQDVGQVDLLQRELSSKRFELEKLREDFGREKEGMRSTIFGHWRLRGRSGRSVSLG